MKEDLFMYIFRRGKLFFQSIYLMKTLTISQTAMTSISCFSPVWHLFFSYTFHQIYCSKFPPDFKSNLFSKHTALIVQCTTTTS